MTASVPAQARALLCLVLPCLLLAACAALPPGDGRSPPSVLVVSLDGVHPDDLDPALTPTLSRLAREGVQAAWMTPSYPSLTFPNHYTLVTGLRPDRHGITHNTMRDAALGRFRSSDRDAVGDGRWWQQGEPVWVTAERAGLPTASLFWPGSEAAVVGVRPRRWTPFDKDMAMAARVDTVLAWLAEPPATRPRLATLYFEHVDTAGHDHGPGSAQSRDALRQVDAALARLVDGLAAHGLRDRIDLVIVSDHGMAAVAPGNVIALEDMVPPEDASVVTGGQSLGFAPRPGREAAAERALLGRHDRYSCWRKGELPAHWHYGSHPRIPPIVCQMDEGWDAIPRASIARRQAGGVRGSHGYAPELPSMRSLFVAHGPSFRRGLQLPPFDNVEVYPLLMRLLGLPPAPHDGGDAALHALRGTP